MAKGIKMVKFSPCDLPYLINFGWENFVLLPFLQVCGFFHVHFNQYYSPQVERKYMYTVFKVALGPD